MKNSRVAVATGRWRLFAARAASQLGRRVTPGIRPYARCHATSTSPARARSSEVVRLACLHGVPSLVVAIASTTKALHRASLSMTQPHTKAQVAVTMGVGKKARLIIGPRLKSCLCECATPLTLKRHPQTRLSPEPPATRTA